MAHACLLIPQDPEYNTITIPRSDCLTASSQATTSTAASATQKKSTVPRKINQYQNMSTPKTPKRRISFSTSPQLKKTKAKSTTPKKKIHSTTANGVAFSNCSSPMDQIFLIQYPRNEIFVRINLDGDVWDHKAHLIEFSKCGRVITYKSRIPEMMLKGSSILQDVPEQDAFQYLLDVEVGERVKKLDSCKVHGGHYECRASVTLPYPVQQKFFNEKYKETKDYTSYATKEGAAYTFFGCFQLVGRKNIS
jgi:hypothetical protein